MNLPVSFSSPISPFASVGFVLAHSEAALFLSVILLKVHVVPLIAVHKASQGRRQKSVSASDIDNADKDIKQAHASIAEAKANLQLAQIDLNRTRITASISGIIGCVS